MRALTPSLSVIAARLETSEVVGEFPSDEDLARQPNDSASSMSWDALPIPPDLAEAFERAAQARAVLARPLATGQIHGLREAPAFGSMLLDAWMPVEQRWQGWLCTPDTSYAGATDLVIEARDAPIDPRVGMVCAALRIEATADQLGNCLGHLSVERINAVRWLGQQGEQAAQDLESRPGVIARVEVPGGYALTGSPLGGQQDPRTAYQRLLEQGIARLQLALAPSAATPSATSPARRPREAANSAQWLKPFAAVAATLAIGQFALLMHFRQTSDSLPGIPAQPDSAPQYRGSAPGVSGGSLLRVLFRPDATEADIRNWLQDQHLQIVAGPDSIGAFMLHSKDTAPQWPTPAADNPLAVINP